MFQEAIRKFRLIIREHIVTEKREKKGTCEVKK
jgi:hypothetical protein